MTAQIIEVSEKTYVPPPNEIEQKLEKIWKQVMKIERISVTDNFFDLGGDSLLAIQLLFKIKKIFNCDIPYVSLLEYPTITEIANLIENKMRFLMLEQTIMPVQPLGNNPPIFWIPSGFGVDLYVQGMAKYMAPDQPLYLLSIPKPERGDILLIPELAKIYAGEIMKFRPQGLYYLAGHSNGGTIACETANQLDLNGGQIGWVSILDTSAPNQAPLGWFELFGLFFINLRDLGFIRALKDMRRNIFVIISMLILKPKWLQSKIIRDRKIPFFDLLEMRQAAYVKNVFVGRLYQPHPFLFKLLLFEAKGFRRYHLSDHTKGWEKFSTVQIKRFEMHGDHVSIMEEPHIAKLAQVMCAEIKSK